MSAELFYLFLTSILLTLMWIPHIIGQVKHGGPLQPEEYVKLRDSSELPHWVKRANRAHINLVEQFGAFVGLVVVAHLLQVSTELTALAAAIYLWSRILHAVVMISGIKIAMLRTLIFTASWAALLVIAWEIAAAKLF